MPAQFTILIVSNKRIICYNYFTKPRDIEVITALKMFVFWYISPIELNFQAVSVQDLAQGWLRMGLNETWMSRIHAFHDILPLWTLTSATLASFGCFYLLCSFSNQEFARLVPSSLPTFNNSSSEISSSRSPLTCRQDQVCLIKIYVTLCASLSWCHHNQNKVINWRVSCLMSVSLIAKKISS